MKDKKELEKIVRGFSNHRRIEILNLLDNSPGLFVVQISERLKVNLKTIAAHTIRLHGTGSVRKDVRGNRVCHTLTPRGKSILNFLRTLE